MAFLSSRYDLHATLAQATGGLGTGVGAVGESSYQGVPAFLPTGYQAAPAAGDTLLLLHLGGSPLALGSPARLEGLAPGEVRITSAGGATLHLKNNGEISLNGLVITRSGQISPKT